MATVGTVPWGLLARFNLKHMPNLPWAVIPAALFLWLFWCYARGDWWPRSTSEARRKSLRANSLPGEVWGAAMIAGDTAIPFPESRAAIVNVATPCSNAFVMPCRCATLALI